MLQTERPAEVFEDLIMQSPECKLKAGNFNICKSPAVIRRIKSQISSTEQLHKDAGMELDMMQKLYKETDFNKQIRGFIQRRGADPFFITFYTEEQLKLLKGNLILYFDATGSIFKKWQGFSKRMLLYSLVVEHDHTGEPCAPVAEMISCDHTTEALSHFLFGLRLDCNRLQSRLGLASFPVELVVTDFSWAMIHAVFHSLNDALTVEKYLHLTHKSLAERDEWCPVTGVFLCANHVIHIVARKMFKVKDSVTKENREAFLLAFALVQYSKTFDDALSNIKLLLSVFGGGIQTRKVAKAKKLLNERIKKWRISDKLKVADLETEDKFSLHDEGLDAF